MLIDDGKRTAQRPTRRRRRWLIALGVVVVALISGAAVFTVLWANRGPSERSTESALEAFRTDTTLAESSASTPEQGLSRPDAGVYEYEGGGSEALSFLGTSQAEGPRLPVTVTHLPEGCWSFRIDYSTHHWSVTEFCPDGAELLETGGTTFQTFDFVAFSVDEQVEFTCETPGVRIAADPEPGESHRQSCTGVSALRDTTVVSAGTNVFVGNETTMVAGEPVETAHYRQTRTESGDQTGESTDDYWYDLATGLPIRNERSIRVESPAPAPIDSVTYTEDGWWQATSLTPQV